MYYIDNTVLIRLNACIHRLIFLTYQMALNTFAGGDSQGMPEEVELIPSLLMDSIQVKGKLTRYWKD